MQSEKILSIREEITKIDDEITVLIKKRFASVEKIMTEKQQKYGNEFLYIDQLREHEIETKHATLFQNIDLEKELAVNIWRNFISFSNFFEQPNLRINYENSSSISIIHEICQKYPNLSQHRIYENVETVSINNASIFAINSQSQTFISDIKFLTKNLLFAYDVKFSKFDSNFVIFFGKILKIHQDSDSKFLMLDEFDKLKILNWHELAELSSRDGLIGSFKKSVL